MATALYGASSRPVRSRASRLRYARFPCYLLLFGVVVMAVAGSWQAPFDPYAQDLSRQLLPPSSTNWLGTDFLGRDVFSRVITGARTAIVGPLVIAALSMLIGNILGLVAGYFGGRVDAVIMRWVDLMWSIPNLLVIIVISGAIGGGYWTAVALLVVLIVPFDTRIVRGAVLEQTPRPYVEAAKSLGLSNPRILVLHIWPNVAGVAVANTFLVFTSALMALAGLSFLGLGVAPGTADWGLMIAEGRGQMFANPVMVIAPSLMIVLTAVCMNLVGDWTYEQLAHKGAER